MNLVLTEPSIPDNARCTEAQAIKLLGISRSTIRRKTRNGELVSRLNKAGTRRHYLGKDLKNFWRINK